MRDTLIVNGVRVAKQDFGSSPPSDCNCGSAMGVQIHTIHAANPTGHAVTCPVFLRWEASQK